MTGYIDSEGQDIEPDANHYLAAAEFVLMLRQKGVRDIAVLRAMEQVARVPFIRDDYLTLADEDLTLPIDAGQMMLPPSTLAKMLEGLQLEKHHRLLILGTGTGYAAALASRLAGEIITVERVRTLADAAHTRLRKQGYARIEVVFADGLQGHVPRAPYDRILSTFAFDDIPQELLLQLSEGGKIVAPFIDRGVYLGALNDGAIEFMPLAIENSMTKARKGLCNFI
jgi:protein-L-isoaspartate(D-aspartate) O-methyltransferase